MSRGLIGSIFGIVVAAAIFVGASPTSASVDYGLASPPLAVSGTATWYPTSVADLNHDGLDDVVFALASGIAIGLSRGDGTFSLAPVYPTSDFDTWDSAYDMPVGVYVADIDVDGTQDLVLVFDFPWMHVSGVSWLHGNGDGTFGIHNGDFNPASPLLNGGGPLVLADVAGDAATDIIEAVRGDETGFVSVAVNAGSGRFSAGLYLNGVFGNLLVSNMRVGGKTEIVTAIESADIFWPNDPEIGVYTGDGALLGSQPLPPGHWNISSRDVDHDGFQDVIVRGVAMAADGSCCGPEQTLVAYGDGSGAISAPVSAALPPDNPREHLQDLNEDGIADLVIAGNDSTQRTHPVVTTSYGQGDGTYLDPVDY